MRISIDHATTYDYDTPSRAIVQVLRLTPRSFEGQQILSWRIESNVDANIRTGEDAFGNVVHTLYTEEPTRQLITRVLGEAATEDTAGVVRGAPERLPTLVYLRQTPLTAPDAAIIDFAHESGGRGGHALDKLHALLGAIHKSVVFDTEATGVGSTAVESFGIGRGVCQDLAHIFIACARVLGIPARYVSGHLLRTDGDDQVAAHAWAEAEIPGLGWIGFDPANGVCPTDAYVRVAVALDYLGAAPVRGASYGGSGEKLSVKLRVRQHQIQQ